MNHYVTVVCKIGQGAACCRYLVVGTTGFECAKLSALKLVLDERVQQRTMSAQADNCAGISMQQSIGYLNDTV